MDESSFREAYTIRKLNILMIYEALSNARAKGGGIQIHVLLLVKALRNFGHNPLLFRTRPLHSDKISIRLAVNVLMQPFLFFFGIVRVLRIVKNMNIHLIHVHGARLPLILGFFICRITRIPLVVTIHEWRSWANKLNRQYKSADKIIVISQEVKLILENYGVDKTKLVYIPNMVDTDFFGSTIVNQDRSDRSYRLVFMGRLHPSKIGILKILLKATPRIVQKLPATQVWVVGARGSKFLEISRMARDINERIGKKVVVLLGYVKDPAKIIQAADIVIGVGRVALEAMAHGKPTIVGWSQDGSTFTGGLVNKENVYELEKYNFTGRNYSERINAQQMTELIVSLLRNEGYRKIVGKYYKKFVKRKFVIKVIIPEIMSVYSAVLNNRSS